MQQVLTDENVTAIPQREVQAEIQEAEYVYPYHYQDVFGVGQSIERHSIFDALVTRLQSHNAKSVIDVGCGDGRFCHYAKNYLEVEGIDTSSRAIQWARAFNPSVKFYDNDIAKLRKTYDAAVCIEVIEHISDADMGSFLDELRQRVALGGPVIFTVPSELLLLDEKHYRHYNEETLRATLSPFFEVNEILGHSRKRPLAKKLFNMLNAISILSYSDRMKYKHRDKFERLAQQKIAFWHKHLHNGPASNCFRLFAICTRTR